MKKKVLVVGSIAFDVVFSVHGHIKNEIPLRNGEIGDVNLMFTANKKKQYFGGTAGNISYGLGLLGESPQMFSVVGNDFEREYKKHLSNLGVVDKTIKFKDEDSALFYGISDEDYNQIGIWQPNIYGENIDQVNLTDSFTRKELSSIDIGIFSPGTGKSTIKHMKEYRENNPEALIIFDPSQVLSIFYEKNSIKEALQVADILIGNETEIKQFKTVFDLNIINILKHDIQYIVETKGSEGATLHTFEKSEDFNAIKTKNITESTGAGDAFRAGLLSGLINNESLEESIKIGSYMGSKSVETYGGQEYKINLKELDNIV